MPAGVGEVRLEIEVRLRTSVPVDTVWRRAADPSDWPPMPGADLEYEVIQSDLPHLLRYRISGGLPLREHEGTVRVAEVPEGVTEIVLHESFRARIWGTGGHLRGRRERALLDLARAWSLT